MTDSLIVDQIKTMEVQELENRRQGLTAEISRKRTLYLMITEELHRRRGLIG